MTDWAERWAWLKNEWRPNDNEREITPVRSVGGKPKA